jgi:hypothetical protein
MKFDFLTRRRRRMPKRKPSRSQAHDAFLDAHSGRGIQLLYRLVTAFDRR